MASIPAPNPRASDIAACARKRAYPNIVVAIAAAQQREAEGAARLTAYKCPEGPHFHLTKMVQA